MSKVKESECAGGRNNKSLCVVQEMTGQRAFIRHDIQSSTVASSRGAKTDIAKIAAQPLSFSRKGPGSLSFNVGLSRIIANCGGAWCRRLLNALEEKSVK
jgi:hypothetical protein